MQRRYEPNLALRGCRKGEGISSADLGAELGLPRNMISLYENGYCRVNLNVRMALSKRYGGTERDYRQKPFVINKINFSANLSRVNQKLRKKIYGAGLTPVEVCRMRGVADSTLSQYISGGVSLGRRVAGEVAGIIGCSIDELVGFDEKGEFYRVFEDGFWRRGRREYNDFYFSFERWKDDCRANEFRNIFCGAMNKLRSRDREILEKSFGINGEFETLEKIGEPEGLDRRVIFERRKRAMARLRFILENGEFRDYFKRFFESPTHWA